MSPIAWERCRSAAYYAGVCVAAVVIVVVAMDLRAASLHIPFAYSRGDARFPEYGFDVTLYLTTIKGLIDNGWILTNQYLGAPEAARFHDFPQFQLDGFQFAVMKIVSLVMRDAAATLNVYFVLTFVLTAAISAYAMRRLRFSRLTAFVFLDPLRIHSLPFSQRGLSPQLLCLLLRPAGRTGVDLDPSGRPERPGIHFERRSDAARIQAGLFLRHSDGKLESLLQLFCRLPHLPLHCHGVQRMDRS